MPSYNKIILNISIAVLFASCTSNSTNITKNTINKKKSNIKTKKATIKNISELQENIILNLALDYEFNKDYKNSAILYERLFKKYKKYEYLEKLLYLNVFNKQYKKTQTLAFENIANYPNKKEYLYQNYVFSSIKLKQYKKALEYSKKLIKIKKSANNYSFLADSYYGLNNYKEAIKYYKKSYKLSKNIKSLLNYTNIMFSNLDQKTKAIKYLKNYIKNNGCNKVICSTLSNYYEKTKNINGVIKITLKMLDKYKYIYSENEILKYKYYILSLYIQQDIKNGIKYLEKERFDDKKLARLYSITNQNLKSLNLNREIYIKTNDLNTLGIVAILENEYDTKNTNKNDIYSKFDKVLQNNDNPIYENYYGYMLLNNNDNLKKALELIKKAYNTNPNNIAYKDSLAYAYYKNKDYENAYKLMKEVVDKIGFDNKEVKEHWQLIKKYKDIK